MTGIHFIAVKVNLKQATSKPKSPPFSAVAYFETVTEIANVKQSPFTHFK